MKLYATWEIERPENWEQELVSDLEKIGVKKDNSFLSLVERAITGFGLFDNCARSTLRLAGGKIAVNIRNYQNYLDKRTDLKISFIPTPMNFDHCESERVSEIALLAESPQLAIPSYQEIAKYALKERVLSHQVYPELIFLLPSK